MRLIRIKLKPDVTMYLRALCTRLKVNDLPFAEDLFAFAATSGNGLPDDARILVLADAYAKATNVHALTIKMLLRKRRQILSNFGKNPVFQYRLQQKKHPRIITEEMLEHFIETFKKLRQSQCVTCQFCSICDFGKAYGTAVTSIHLVLDPKWDSKVHPECPERPNMDFMSQMEAAQHAIQEFAADPNATPSDPNDPALEEAKKQIEAATEAAAQLQAMAAPDSSLAPSTLPRSVEDPWEDEDNAIGLVNNGATIPGVHPFFTATFSQAHVPVDLNIVSKIKLHNFILWDLSRKLGSKLIATGKGKYKPVADVTKDKSLEQIKSVSEVSRVVPKEHAQNDDVFQRKLINKQLNIVRSTAPNAKRHLQYILIDVSDSMNSCVGTQTPLWSVVTRGLLAATFTLALMELVETDGGIVFFRPFDGNVGPLRSARAPIEFSLLRKLVSVCRFNGMSTDIERAIRSAMEDITAAKDELCDAEILLITDCGARISDDFVNGAKKLLGKTSLHVLDVAANQDRFELAASNALKKMATNYFRVDASATMLDKLVTLVTSPK